MKRGGGCWWLLMPVMTGLCAAVAQGQVAGVAPEWDIRKQIAALGHGVQQLEPILAQARPHEWVAQGAPEAYVAQWETIQAELGHLRRSLQILDERPDRLFAALDAYFRMERLAGLLDSFEHGVRRYQNPALADLLRGVFGETMPFRENLRQYLLELAESKEHELEVAEREAQRCRDWLVRQPPGRGASPAEKPAPSGSNRP